MSEESPETDGAPKQPAKPSKPKKRRGEKSRRILKGFLGFSWPIFAFFVVSVFVTLLVMASGFLSGQPMIELVQTDSILRLIYQLLIMIGVLIFVVVPLFRIFFKKGVSVAKVLGLAKKPRTSDLGWALLMYGGYLVATVITFVVVSQLVPGIDLEESQELGVDAPATLVQFVLVFITLAVIPPLFEELIFRGFVFKALREEYSFWVSAVLTSLAFAVVHLQVNVGIDVFILSLFLCYLRERTGSLWAPIILHGVKNALAFVLLFVLR